MSLSTVFFQMLALLVMIGAGWIAARTGMLDAHTNGQLSKLIVNIFNPLLIFSSAASAVGTMPRATLGAVALIAAGMFLVFILAGMVMVPFFDKDPAQRAIFQLMFVFSNLGFIGVPVVRSVLGPEYVIYITPFLLVYGLVFYTYGVALMEGRFSLAALKSMVNPGNIACVLALVLVVFSLPLPDFLLTAATYLGNVTTPLALMAVGYTLAHSDPRQIAGDVRLYVFSAIKLLALPLAMLPLLRLLPVDASLVPVCMVMFGMPVGNMPLMLGTQKGIDCRVCTAAIIMTTILCVVTVPIILAIAV